MDGKHNATQLVVRCSISVS